jgi:hypothetical protein
MALHRSKTTGASLPSDATTRCTIATSSSCSSTNAKSSSPSPASEPAPGSASSGGSIAGAVEVAAQEPPGLNRLERANRQLKFLYTGM